MESGSSGSGDFLSDRDEEIRRISELQISIPYKKRKNSNGTCSSFIYDIENLRRHDGDSNISKNTFLQV